MAAWWPGAAFGIARGRGGAPDAAPNPAGLGNRKSLFANDLRRPFGATFGTDRSVASPTYLNTVGVWAEVTPRVAGVFTLLSVRLHFRVNGGPEQTSAGINDILTVCAADPAPSPGDCAPTPSGGG